MLGKTSRSWGKQDSETLLETIFHVEEKKKALQNANDMKEKNKKLSN